MYLTVLLLTTLGTYEAETSNAECHMIVFSGNRSPLKPRFSHTFAVFTRKTFDDDAVSLETVSLSWVGSDPNWRLFDPPQPGRNLTLEQTLQRCVRRGQQITMWGPYRIDPLLYERAEVQMQRLERGEICWQALDGKSRSQGRAINCIHVIGALNREDGRLKTGFAHGDAASRQVVLHLQRFIWDECPGDGDLPRLLGLDRYPIRRERIGLRSRAEPVRPVPSPCGGVH